jgi:hypothetical protein
MRSLAQFGQSSMGANSLRVRISPSVREGTISLDLDRAREASYTVARGIRPMALVYDGLAKPAEFLKLASQLEAVCDPNCLSFVVDHHDGRVGAAMPVLSG